jgi:hypothetical protein
METVSIKHLALTNFNLPKHHFEEAFYDSKLKFLLRNMNFGNDMPETNIMNALHESISVCNMAGINSKHHFKKIYISDIALDLIYTDWLMSKKGVNLVIMHIPSSNQERAVWLCKLADL